MQVVQAGLQLENKSQSSQLFTQNKSYIRLQSIDGLDLPTDCWPHFPLPTGRGERFSNYFNGDVWSALPVH